MTIDIAASLRQTFGTTFDPALVQRLLEGYLTMSPHPEWRLPEQIDWAADPFHDVNWQSQFHMLRWLEPLRRAAAKGDQEAANMWLRYARDWVRSNPRDAAAHKWVWSDMVDGIRAIHLCLAAPMLQEHSPDDLSWLEQTIRDHAEFMADSANLGHSNHAMHQHEALLVCGRVLGEQHFVDLAISRFEELLTEQYDAQGINAEGAIAYHYNNYLWYERSLKRFDAEGIPRPEAAARHALAPEAIAHATRPDGTFVPIGDTDGGSPRGIRTPFTDYVSSGGSDGEAPGDLLRIYEQGYAFARSGWGETERNFDEETFFSLSFGASDRVHGHPDGGSLTFSADTVNWIVDPGKYQYGRSIPRRHMLSRASHSLVSIDGQEPRRPAEVVLQRQVVTDRAYDLLLADDSFLGIDLTRRVIYSRNGEYLVVIDHVRSPEPVTARQRWQLGPGVRAELSQNRADLTSGAHRAAIAFSGTATSLSQVTGVEDPFDGWVATAWKKKTPATAITATKRGTSFRFISTIAVGSNREATVATVPISGPVFGLEVSTGRITEQIVIHPEHVVFPGDLDGRALSGSSGVPDRPPLPTRSGNLHVLDPRSRRDVFRLQADSRRNARSANPQQRGALAQALEEEARFRGLDSAVDLGLTAAVTDLRGTIRGRIDPQQVEPHRTALINWDGNTRWRPTFYHMPVKDHGDSFELTSRPREAAIHTVDAGPLVLPIALDPARGNILTVLFQGAVERAKVRTPMFLRWRHQTGLGVGPTLALADPTLDLSSSMRLGWYLGTETTDLIPLLASVIRRSAESLGVEHIVLSGSSGGGFAALQVGTLLPEALVLAMSPQTDLRAYSRRLVDAAIQPAFGVETLAGAAVPETRVSVLDHMAARGEYPRVELLSNPGDKVHVKRHEGPLRDAYAATGHSDRFRTHQVDLGTGHRSVDNATYSSVLRRALDTL